MHPMQPYINLYIFLIQVYASYASYAAVYNLVYTFLYNSMHPMQSYMNLYIFSYINLCIYVSMHPMQMIKLVFNSNGLISCLVSNPEFGRKVDVQNRTFGWICSNSGFTDLLKVLNES